jgi:hypothetical protein
MANEPTKQLNASPDAPPSAAWQGPAESRWKSLLKLAEVIASSGLAPKALKGRPADVLHIFLVAEELGVPPMYALAKVYIIEGIPTIAAEMKAALVRRSLLCEEFTIVENTDKRCEIRLQRKGDARPTSFEWTIDEAYRAGLLHRPQKPNDAPTGKDNWRNYPKDMLLARCIDRATQAIFQDVLGGLTATETMQDVAYARDVDGGPMSNEEAITRRIGEVLEWIEAASTIPDLQEAIALINKEPREVKANSAIRTAVAKRKTIIEAARDAEIETETEKATEEVEIPPGCRLATKEEREAGGGLFREIAPSLAPAKTMELDFGTAPKKETVAAPKKEEAPIAGKLLDEILPPNICPGCDADVSGGQKHAYDCPTVTG